MKFLTVLTVYLVLQLSSCEALVGAYSDPSNALKSDPHFLQIHEYMLKQHPQLKDAQVVSVSTQIVAGTNYKIHYKYSNGTQYEAVVFDQPWTHHRNITSFHEKEPVTI